MKHLLKHSLSTVLLPSLVALALAPCARPVNLGNVWPLGDSVTYGAGQPGGYRDTLCTNLTARGYTFKFVGTLTANPTKRLSAAGQTHHDGHSGYTIANAADISGKFRRGLYQGLESWHRSIKNPDLILLMIGINDLNIGYEVDTAPERLNLLVNRLFDYYPVIDAVDDYSCHPDFTVLVYPAYLERNGHLASDLNLRANIPPTLIIHNLDDKRFVEGSRLYHAALDKAKVPNKLILYRTGGHGYGLRGHKAVRVWPQAAAEWLHKLGIR